MNTAIQSVDSNKVALKKEFVRLLLREGLINKETYYNAMKSLKEEEDRNGYSK